jgi:hypothetical protein
LVYTEDRANIFEVWFKANRTLPGGTHALLEGFNGDGLSPAETMPPGGRTAARCYSAGYDNTLNSSASLSKKTSLGDTVRLSIQIPRQRNQMLVSIRTMSAPRPVTTFKGYTDTEIGKLRRLGCAGAKTWARNERAWKRCDRAAKTAAEHNRCEDRAIGIR